MTSLNRRNEEIFKLSHDLLKKKRVGVKGRIDTAAYKRGYLRRSILLYIAASLTSATIASRTDLRSIAVSTLPSTTLQLLIAATNQELHLR